MTTTDTTETMPLPRTVAAIYDALADGWDTADWTHESDDGETYCEGGAAETCSRCREAEASADRWRGLIARSREALERDDVAAALRTLADADREERQWGDAPLTRDIQQAIAGAYRCQCGEVTGVRCTWIGPRDQTVVIEWMPEHLRASHEAAGGNSGVYPHNGAWRLRVERDTCAAMLSDDEREED